MGLMVNAEPVLVYIYIRPEKQLYAALLNIGSLMSYCITRRIEHRNVLRAFLCSNEYLLPYSSRKEGPPLRVSPAALTLPDQFCPSVE